MHPLCIRPPYRETISTIQFSEDYFYFDAASFYINKNMLIFVL